MTKSLTHPDYPVFLTSLKKRILKARLTTARSVNSQLILLYWDIGQGIVEKQKSAGWGDAVVGTLATDLKAEFPDMRGVSQANIWRMKQFYEYYTSPEFLSQAVRELGPKTTQKKLSQAVRELVGAVPWGHHSNVLIKVSDPSARLYYLKACAHLGWSRDVLLNQVKAGAFERAKKEKKTHNFQLALPEYLSEQADEMLKSRYNLEFLGLTQAVKERQLEDRLISHMQHFILELGYGFCFVGRQYRLTLKDKEYFVDLLFYHRFLKSLVAFDLKVGSFTPEHAGKMDFYLNVLNDKERDENDNPSIGIILCAKKDDLEVEYSLKTKTNPIGVAQYELKNQLPNNLKGKLPTAKQLGDAMRQVLPKRK